MAPPRVPETRRLYANLDFLKKKTVPERRKAILKSMGTWKIEDEEEKKP